MKLISLRNNLLEAINSVEKSVGISSNLPILSNIKLEAKKGNEVVFTSTDLEIAISHTVSSKVFKEGVAVIPFNVFSNIIKNLSSEKINLEIKNKKMIISADNYEASINCVNSEEFPIIPKIQNENYFVRIKSSFFKNALSKTLTATQYSDIRPEINGVYVNFDGGQMIFAGTDSFRLVEVKVGENGIVKSTLNNTSFIIPLKTVENVLRILDGDDEIGVFVDPNQILMKTEKISVISRLVDGNFPDYTNVIPKETKADIYLERLEIINAVKVTKTFAGKANDIILKTTPKNILEVYSADSSVGENNYKVPAKIKNGKFDLSLVFNWRYLLSGLKIFEDEDVLLGIIDKEKPVVIKGKNTKDTLYVVMPIRG